MKRNSFQNLRKQPRTKPYKKQNFKPQRKKKKDPKIPETQTKTPTISFDSIFNEKNLTEPIEKMLKKTKTKEEKYEKEKNCY